MNSDAAKPWIIAHRGASHDAPENTLAAFDLAWQRGADGIEGDFRLARDGQVVCIHDATTERTAQRDLVVAESTLAELKKLDVGRWKDGAFAGQRIPLMDEVLAIVPRGKRVFLELKTGPEIVGPVVDAIRRTSLDLDQISVIAFDQRVVGELKKSLPQATVNWLTRFHRDEPADPWLPGADAAVETLALLGADGLGVQSNPQAVDAAFARRIIEAGYPLHVWTVNEPKLARHFLQLGVRSITTNHPQRLRRLAVQDSRPPF